eukprot:5281644-Prymnesium_polylepis.1
MTQFVIALDNKDEFVTQETRGVDRAMDARYKGPYGGSDDDANKTTYTTTFVYDAFEGNNIFDAAGVAAMYTMEKALLDSPGWSTYCRKGTNLFNASEQACYAPTTALNWLYPNASKHQEECEAGYCVVPNPILMATTCGTT